MAGLLLDLLLDPGKGASLALHILHRTGLLVTLVPEFEKISGRIQRDLYHVFTVDEHTLRAVDKLKALARGEHEDLALATGRMRALQAAPTGLRPLVVAMFLHDLGKGYGPGHHERGAELALVIGPRLGLSEAEVEQVRLLVFHQADMPLLCQRRDPADPRPVRGLARIVGDVETLDQLFLLSVADWSSVGQETFSGWQRTLLDGLYLRTRDLLLHPGIYADPKGIADARREALLVAELGQVPSVPGAESDPIDDFCSALPTRYFQLVDGATMQAHFHMWLLWRSSEDARAPVVDVVADPQHGQAVITVVCADEPGVLARLTRGLAAVGADLLAAEIHSLAGGTVLDVFRARDPHGRFAQPRNAEQVKDAIARGLAGEELRAKAPETWGFRASLPPIKAEVTISNDAASEHSVVDVIAGDRPKLLHDIARFFADRGVSIDLAFIATEGRVARDSFYVADANGKMLSESETTDIAQKLTAVLDTAAG
ncbi:MAG: ACT domain-containing protein [Myxococcota bacterium]